MIFMQPSTYIHVYCTEPDVLAAIHNGEYTFSSRCFHDPTLNIGAEGHRFITRLLLLRLLESCQQHKVSDNILATLVAANDLSARASTFS